MEVLMNNLPLFIPLIIAQLVLSVAAVIHVMRHSDYRFGNRIMWILTVLLIQPIGPIAYFIFGRGDE